MANAQARTRPPTQRALASLWAALLRDSLSLFAYRERPLEMLELAPKARAFAEIYAETLRTSGPGASVPIRLVLPQPPTLARSFREMTMSPPSDAGARSGAAVEGRWVGTMESDGSRQLQLRLRLEGSRLAGAVTSEAGKLTMNTPVRDAVYEKGRLRFVVDLYGSPRLFSGTVTADTIEGTIERAGGDKARLGTFALRYVE
jgi:hypothetical protein